MESDEYRTVYKEHKYIGELPILFEGEHYKGDKHGILDTKVSINEKMLCWIIWKDRDEFLRKINNVIDEYRI